MAETASSPPIVLRLAPAIFAFLWSTGWLAAKLVAPFVDPLTFLAARFAFAAGTLTLAAWWLGVAWPRGPRGLLHAAASGVLLHAIYVGGVWWSVMHGLPVAISGLVSALQPILTALLAPALAGETITRRQWLGIALGFAGILLVLGPALSAIPPGRLGETVAELTANLVAIVSITLGTFYQKRFVTSGHLVTVTSLQYTAATVAILPAAWLLEPMRLDWNWTTSLAMAWSVIGNSIISVILLMLLIRNGAVSRAAALIFLMPPLVAVEAYLLFGETLTAVQMLGIALTSCGVALAVRRA